MNFAQVIYDRLLKTPEAESLIWPIEDGSVRRYTAGEILNRIATLRAGLESAGLQPGHSVLLAVPVSFEAICSLLAVMSAGAIPVLPPAGILPKALLRMAIRERYQLLLTRQKLPWLVRMVLGLFSVKTEAVESIVDVRDCPVLPPQQVSSEQAALVSHSSGSTGTPKAIRRSHSVLQAQHQALLVAFPPWPGQRDFPLFPNVLLHNLAVGTVSILPYIEGFKLNEMEPQKIAAQLLKEGVETMTGNVFYFRELLQYCNGENLCFPQVKAVGVGGSPVPESLMQSLKTVFTSADVYIIYGSSEAEPIAIRKVAAENWNCRNGYLVGTIHPTIQVQFRNSEVLVLEDGTPVSAGEIGVQGAHVATAKNSILWTGDWGYLAKDGQLVLTGRQGNSAAHQGIQHYQLEHVLSQVPGVQRIAARANEHHFTVYVEGTATMEDVQNTLAAHFPPQLVGAIYYRNKLPVDARHLSKIRYEALV